MRDEQPSPQQRYDKAREQRRNKQQAKAGPSALQMILPPPSDPMAVARQFVDARCLHNGADQLTLRHWCGCWWVWRTTHWVEAEPRTVCASLWHFTEHAVYLDGIK